MENFKALSLTFENATVDLREYVALNEDETKSVLSYLSSTFGIQELIVISTCNRTEFFYVSENSKKEEIFQALTLVAGKNLAHVKNKFFEISDHDEAVRRLFEVSLGLHSQIIGDMQISNQVKRAYQMSADVNVAGPFLHRIMHTVFFANKRVQQETALRDGAASIAYASKELVEDLAKHLSNPIVLIIGAGEIGSDLIDNLRDTSALVYITNRTFNTAKELADKYGFYALEFDGALEFVKTEADIIVSSIAVEKPLITADLFVGVKQNTHKYFLDLSVPSSIERTINQNDSVVLYTLDELNSKADETLEQRINSIEPAKQIISELIEEFNDWTKEMVVSPAIKALKETLESIRQDELKRFLKKADKGEQDLLDKASKSMMQKVLKLPVLNLKAACKRGEAETLVDVLNDLFNLEKEKTKA